MKYIFTILLFLVICITSPAQLYINEFMASNSSTIKDPDYNADADWIELYNDGSSSINLQGYYLTDNLDIPNKWAITNVVIPAKGYVIFWADGNNTGNHTSFKLDAQVEQIGLFSPALALIDSISYVNQQPDVSQGRNPDNLMLWGHFSTATPNAANTTEFFSDFALNEPMFNIRGGIYNSGQQVKLFTDMGGEIHYTLDGSAPTQSSPLYVAPINIDSTTVVRARILKPDMLPGPVITNTYFINENIQTGGLPVVSLASEPANFWDPTKGIYVQSFKPDWEIPVNIELFENNGADRAAFNEVAGVKINGLYSWQLPQKMLGVYFKKRYGTGSLDYSIFYDSPRASFKTFALRASGNDWSNTLMRDILGQNSTLLNMKLDISAFRWCTVYFNGQYMGIHNFREKIETDYIEKHYGLEAGTFDMVENEDYAECGDLTAYNNFKTLYTKDLSIQSNFDAVAAQMDIENFTDLVITEIASGNTSIDHNVMAWKPRDTGQWKWILMDLDRGYFTSTSSMISFYINQTVYPFSNLMKNAAYKSYFGKRLADHLYTSFNAVTMHNLIEKHRQEILPEIPQHVKRWLGTTSSYGDAMPSVDFWENEVVNLKTFTEERPSVILNDLKNYGFDETAQLTLSVYPENAGTLKLNDFKIPQNQCTSPYLKNINSQVSVEGKAGYTFRGWANAEKTTLIAKQSTWKYLVDGTDKGSGWKEVSFDDTSWSSGQGKLGYGQGDEKTKIGYGASSSNKNVTTYFRHSFNVNVSDLTGNDFRINLLRDDAAVVYLNGVEIIRDNIKPGTINYKTLAATATSDICEKTYYSFRVDKGLLKAGVNVLAVEIHQSSVTSSDLSFDLELLGYKPGSILISTEKTYPFSLTTDLNLVAVFEPESSCIVPEVISENTTLFKSCSPYIVRDNVIINNNVTLTIEPGVEILLSPESNIFIHGNINAIGTATEQITFKINPLYTDKSWGALNFWNCSATSSLKYVKIDDATRGPIPQRVGAISGFYGNLNLDHITIDKTKQNPIATRYSDVTLTNSYIHSSFTSDLLNIKYGHARIENCIFEGNAEYDSDAIDYDGIENGIIRNTKILNTLGNNGDAIDIGEESHNIIIDSVLIINAYDKGVSIGQRSSVKLTNSLLLNCNIGAAVKDSSRIYIDKCTFYGNGSSVSCYEKNPGRAGGNARVKNSILSNAYLASYQSDSKSTIAFSNCISDNDLLPVETSNLFGNSLFRNPTLFDFSLSAGSPARLTGSQNGLKTDMGTYFSTIAFQPEVLICGIYLNPLNTLQPEYLALYNPSLNTVDLSDYRIDKGVDCSFPQGTMLAPGDTLYVTADASGWRSDYQVVQWNSGKLSNEGEAVQLLNKYGLVADYLKYSAQEGWPVAAFNSDFYLSLNSPYLDNHFGQNWKAKSLTTGLKGINGNENFKIQVYPNPAADWLTLKGKFETNSPVALYTISGQKIKETTADRSGYTVMAVSDLKAGIYIIKAGSQTVKVTIAGK